MEDGNQPLLHSRKYRDGCPGCYMERQKEERKGYPIKEFLLIGLVALCNALPISSLFPYIYFMVRDFDIAKTEDIGYYAGIVGSAFMFGRFLTSAFWGCAADKYGRKPIIIISLLALILFNTLFGLSLNFWMAVSTRFCLGCFNGLFGAIRAYASEVCREEHQAMGMSLVGTSWGIGLIIGPALGGYLAQPAEKYPNIFSKASLFGRFPYFLPSLCITFLAIISVMFAFMLPETLHNHMLESGVKDDNDPQLVQMDQCHEQNRSSTNSKQGNLKLLLRNWAAMSSIIIYCVYGLTDIAYSEIFSLWCVSPKDYGGLNLSTSDVGTILSISGLGVLAFQFLLFPLLSKSMGPIQLARIPLILSVPLLAVHPFIALLSGILLWVAINFASGFRTILSVAANTGMFLLLNNSVPQRQRGFANGVSLTAMSLSKTVGPSAAGALSCKWKPNFHGQKHVNKHQFFQAITWFSLP
eukprot:TRINITY_DN13378_c0_g1_i11.p1 TRINITY_DN13378_c0_g1~~TRINITY_DN13378_c0_g1_i11.p1  ORF type:complete len:469 (+),score=70.38 TRINITY_DN13378_c0_g1_i11:75-1481(+)